MDALMVISREEALAKDFKRYFTGEACAQGHKAQRNLKGRCIECHRASKRTGKPRGRPPLSEEDRIVMTRPPWLPGDTPWTPSPQSPGAESKYRLFNIYDSFTPDPPHWPDDGGKLRVPIYDHNFGQKRLVRRVGWVNCLGVVRHRFLSPDVAKARICTSCRARETSD